MAVSLSEIVAHKQKELRERKRTVSQESLQASVCIANNSFESMLAKSGVHFIAEIKPKSPSAGVLRQDLQLNTIVQSYNKHASAVSVLTDGKFFGGSIDLLKEIRELSALPILCKDFFLDVYQCLEARCAGADAILLIAKILDDSEMACLYKQATDLGMTAVFEIQNDEELARVKALNPRVVAINNRNLDTFEIDLSTTVRLAPLVPPGALMISASGIESGADVKQLMPFCTNFLIGSTLMAASDVEKKFLELKGEPSERPVELIPGKPENYKRER
jgi:indole-3-glycerol phosphate synthase